MPCAKRPNPMLPFREIRGFSFLGEICVILACFGPHRTNCGQHAMEPAVMILDGLLLSLMICAESSPIL